MKDTVKFLLESCADPNKNSFTKNVEFYNTIDCLDESYSSALKFNAYKVAVNQCKDKYIVEFGGNLERFMADNNLNIGDAMTAVANQNDLDLNDCTLVFKDEDLDSVDFKGLLASDPDFQLARV